MGKCVAYVAAAVVFLGIGALVSGLLVWYISPPPPGKFSTGSRHAMCNLISEVGVAGTLTFDQDGDEAYVKILGNITGLTSGLHGFHIHQWGVSNDDCLTAGGHYNPDNYNHAAPNATQRHVGDLGNIETVDNGTTFIDILDGITLSGARSVVGRAIVVHEGEDDLGLGGDEESLRTGNAGARVACCTIYLVPKN